MAALTTQSQLSAIKADPLVMSHLPCHLSTLIRTAHDGDGITHPASIQRFAPPPPLAALNHMRTGVLTGTIPTAVSNTGATLSIFLKSDPLLSVAAAINQHAANQQTMQQQFVSFTMQRNTSYQLAQVVQPPITQFLILS